MLWTIGALVIPTVLGTASCASRLDRLLSDPHTGIADAQKRCERDVPTDAQTECFNRLGDHEFERREYRSALVFYDRAAAPANAPRIRNSLYRVALEDSSRGEYETAQRHLERAGYSPAESLVELGDVAFERRQYAEAAKLYEAGQLPNSALRLRMSFYRAALDSAARGDLTSAEAQFQHVGYSAGETELLLADQLLTKGKDPAQFRMAVEYFRRAGFTRARSLSTVADKLLPEAITGGLDSIEALAASMLREAGLDPAPKQTRLHHAIADQLYAKAAAADLFD